jgi:hypothetical protein
VLAAVGAVRRSLKETGAMGLPTTRGPLGRNEADKTSLEGARKFHRRCEEIFGPGCATIVRRTKQEPASVTIIKNFAAQQAKFRGKAE